MNFEEKKNNMQNNSRSELFEVGVEAVVLRLEAGEGSLHLIREAGRQPGAGKGQIRQNLNMNKQVQC